MKKLITLHLAFVLLLSSMAPAFAQKTTKKPATSTCENGECIEGIITKLENLSALYKKQCLPPKIKESEIAAYHEKNGFTEACWKYITEIKHYEEQLAYHQNKLEAKLGCASGDCKSPDSPGESLNAQLKDLSKIEQQNSCTPEKKTAIARQCPADMNCAMMSSAMGVGGYLAELVIPKNWKPTGCNLGDDSCITQLATGFLKAAFTFFDAAWDILKFVGKKAGQALNNFWNWVSDAEDHSSTSQLALAKASQDKGVFEMLVNDFPGTMKKIWQALVASLKEWLKTDMFCQKWSGAPHLSKCLKPTDNFDCLPCKTMVNGLCAISGAIIAEVVPAFFTGGLTTAAKYGAQGATKIAKLFKVSSKTMKTLKASKLGKNAITSANKVDDILKITKGVKATKTAIEGAMAAIRAYMLTPSRKLMKSSLAALSSLAKKGGAAIAVTPAGKILVFSGKALKTTGKVVLYPIDNPMTTAAFKSGQRTFEKAFKLGSPKLITAPLSVSSKVIQREPALESTLAKLEAARVSSKPQLAEVARLEQEAFDKLQGVRKELVRDFFKESDDLDDVIKNLYPELEYSTLSKNIGTNKVLAAEKELWDEISQLSDGPVKDELMRKYQLRVDGNALRNPGVTKVTASPEKIVKNAGLSPEARFQEAMITIKRTPVDQAEAKKLKETLEKAHLSGDKEVFEYSWRELREKYRILTEGGYTPAEADELLRVGLAGRPPVRELIEPGKTLFSGFAEDILDGDYLTRRAELQKLLQVKGERPKFFQRLFGAKTPVTETAYDNVESLFFIDYRHNAPELNKILDGNVSLKDAKLSGIYNEQAFKNFKETRNWLLDNKPDLTKETLLEIHKRMVKNGVADFGTPADLGAIRTGDIMGNVPPAYGLNADILKELNSNPYLQWVEAGISAEGKHYGRIHYPNPGTVNPKALDLIRESHPKVVIDIEDFQKIPDRIAKKHQLLSNNKLPPAEEALLRKEIKDLEIRHSELTKNKKVLTQKLTDALVDDLMDWFTRERTLIGEINSPEKLDEYVSLLADFQKRLVSIHPLTDGNGRSTREFISYALMKEGFPPPRILDPNADLYTSLDDWKKMIKHGMLNSDFLMDDLIERAKFGLTIEKSTDLITPYSRPPVKVALKGEKKVPFMEGVEYIDPRLYREIVKRMLKTDPGLQAELVNEPLKAWDKINKHADEIFSKNNAYYKHPKKGLERIEIGYVDEDFKTLFGKSSYDNQELFDFKMKSWYSDDINWRGLASRHAEKSEDEIIGMFKELNSHMASNAVVGKVRGAATPEAIKKAALEDFDKLNDGIFGDGLVAMARDHSETGPMYGISYGYSTSKNREVGKAFAMGAMVVGKYGEHKLPELQALLKSRVLVGAKKSVKDVDLGRLKQLRPEFSYKYGRQQEVMGVGASDPDAITIIQTIDAQGEVMLTYLRNPQKADEIWVIKGDIDPAATPTQEQLVKTIKLTR